MNIFLVLHGMLAEILPVDSMRRRFARGAFWSLIAALLSEGFALLALVVAARMLGKEGYGELGIIRGTIGMLGIIAGLGVGITATKHVGEYRANMPQRAGRIVGLMLLMAGISSSVAALILLLGAPLLAKYALNAPHLVVELRIACILLILNILTGAQYGVLAGLEAFKALARVGFVRGVLNFLFIVLGILYYGAVAGVLLGMAVAETLALLYGQISVQRQTRNQGICISYRTFAAEVSILWKFSLPAMVSQTLCGPIMWAAYTILVNQRGGYAELGIFTAAQQFERIIKVFEEKLCYPLLPMLASRDGQQHEKLNLANILVPWIIGVAGGIPLMCFPELLGWVFGAEFGTLPGRRTLVVIICSTCVVLFTQGVARLLVTHNLLWWATVKNILWAIFLLGSLSFLKRYGALGLACSFLLAYGVMTLTFLPLYIRWKLLPKRVVLSRGVVMVWAIVAGLAILGFLNVSIYLRLLVLTASAFPLFASFKSILNTSWVKDETIPSVLVSCENRENNVVRS